ncbi:nuclear transport factor 2 family protein [Paraburkholderia tropica]|uniref:nuclear transport factor 2 family protein n=1 Tax=Paraburkholderia tropica TaxID=92647 RepID=UPI0007ECA49A|nr:nuclear transport factor 2 family protein [Paraburkholderia tropica]OBR54722.1 ketosteroid isomerase [Paraburkholderia tropica]
MSPTSVLPDWFTHAIADLKAGNIEGWMAIYAQDAIHEFPFAPEGAPRELVGRDAIAAYMSQLPGLIRFGTLSNVRVREAEDEVIIEATGHHRRLADDAPFELSYVWFITRRGELVQRFRDYMNPLQLSSAVSA